MTGGDRGADFLQLSRAAAPVRGLTSWLAGAVRAAIMDGRLPAGTSLPATRLLAGDLGISRGVVVEAYQRLADEGLVSGRPGTGTRVSELAPRPVRQKKDPVRPGQAGATLLPQPWRARAELDLSPGVPDLSGFPRGAWLRDCDITGRQRRRGTVEDIGGGHVRHAKAVMVQSTGPMRRIYDGPMVL